MTHVLCHPEKKPDRIIMNIWKQIIPNDINKQLLKIQNNQLIVTKNSLLKKVAHVAIVKMEHFQYQSSVLS